MKNIIFLSLFIIFFNVMSSIANNCNNYCDPPQWKYKTLTYYDYAYGCNVTVNFRWDTCGNDCPGEPDCNRYVEILSVSYSGTNCNLVPDANKMQRALRIILWESSDFMNVSYPGGGYKVRVSLPACWARTGTTFSPCSSQKCCADYILTTTNGYVELTDKTIYGGDLCGIGNCQEYCDILDLPLGTNIYPDVDDFCRGNCEEAGWTMLPTMKYEGSYGNCNFVAYFAMRYCRYREFMIHRIELGGNCNPDDIEIIYNYAIRNYLAQYGPVGNGNRDTVTLRAFNCWYILNNVMLPCVTTCCEKTYCLLNDNGAIKCENQSPIDIPGNDCVPNLCKWVCDNLSVPENVRLPKLGNIEPIYTNNSEAMIIPNPNTGSFELKFTSQLKGAFQLSIYNEQGKQIYRKQFNKSGNQELIIIDMQNYPSGIYYYRIEHNSENIITGIFSIMK